MVGTAIPLVLPGRLDLNNEIYHFFVDLYDRIMII